MRRSCRTKRESLFLPGVRIDDGIVIAGDLAEAARSRGAASGRSRPSRARRRHDAGAAACRRHAADRLRQRHRARQQEIHERGDRANAPRRGAGDFVGPELCRRCGARLADGGDAGGGRRQARRRIGASGRLGDVPALSFERRARRRDRRRGQERARHRRRRRCRSRARRQRACGADHARLCRTGAFRQSLRRQAGNHDGPVRARRSPAHLLVAAVAQFHLRRQSRPRP